MTLDRAAALLRAAGAPLGHLATTRPDGRPHVVAATFAVDGTSLFTMVDHKPKSSTTSLQRLANIAANPFASFLVDHYEEDWDALWWVRVDGPAVVVEAGDTWERAGLALAEKYPIYRERPPAGPAIEIVVERVSWWEAAP